MRNNNHSERPTSSPVTRRRGKDVIKSAGRSLEVLELFRDVQRPLRLTDIAAALSLPQSSASMLIRSLIKMGYLIRQDRLYAPSLRITLLGSWLNDAMFKQGNLMSLITEIGRLTGDMVLLSTRNGLNVEMLAVIPAETGDLEPPLPGEARPLTRALAGYMILSTLDKQEAEALVLRINAEQKRPERRVKYQTLAPELDRMRQDGHGYAEGTIPNAAVVAVLLPPGPFGDQFVISVVGPIGRIRARRDEILDILHTTIRKYLRHPR